MSKPSVILCESHVKREVKKILDSLGAFYFMPAASIYGRAGVSDFVGLIRGRFFAIETKFGNNKPTILQMLFGERVTHHGGLFLVVNETNLHEVKTLVETL